MTDPFAEIAGSVVREERTAVVTSMLDRRLTPSGAPTSAVHIPDYLSYGCLGVELSDSEATVIRQLSRFQLLPTWQALQLGTQDIRTSGGPAISVFANSAWRLLIASRTVMMPDVLDGACLESVRSDQMTVLSARLFALQAPKPDINSNAMNVWRAVVRAADDEAISSFLYTALELSQRAMSGRLKAYH